MPMPPASQSSAPRARPAVGGAGGAGGGKKERWLVHHYCQGTGLADNLRLLCGDIEFEVIDQHCTEDYRQEVLARMDGFDCIVVEPTIARQFGTADKDRLIVVPTFAFGGYHPDCCLLRREDQRQFAGPTGSSQSMIALAAFQCGLSEGDAVALYRREVFEACGYLDQWAASREALLSSFARHGFDLQREFVRWSRRGPFMHSIIHPRIECLRDVAAKILARAGKRVLAGDFLPPDSLAYREVMPVYPEIAHRLGIAGSYLFKRGNDQRVFDLAQYVQRSFAGFRKVAEVDVLPAYRPMVSRVKTAIEGFA